MEKTDIYFITGNQSKADYLSSLIGIPIKHKKIDLDEIQSLDLHEIVKKKARTAYEIVNAPVIVEDVALEFDAMKGLPGPFIKFFVDTMGLDNIVQLVKGKKSGATARCVIGYYDGSIEQYFEGSLSGTIAPELKGENGFGWDKIFIPDGYGGRTRAELTKEEDRETYLIIKPLYKLRDFLLANDNKKQ